jgi:hypothetical protein
MESGQDYKWAARPVVDRSGGPKAKAALWSGRLGFPLLRRGGISASYKELRVLSTFRATATDD